MYQLHILAILCLLVIWEAESMAAMVFVQSSGESFERNHPHWDHSRV